MVNFLSVACKNDILVHHLLRYVQVVTDSQQITMVNKIHLEKILALCQPLPDFPSIFKSFHLFLFPSNVLSTSEAPNHWPSYSLLMPSTDFASSF